MRRRTVHRIDLVEVSVITRDRRPAYRQTWIGPDTDANRRRIACCRHDALDQMITDVEMAY